MLLNNLYLCTEHGFEQGEKHCDEASIEGWIEYVDEDKVERIVQGD